MSDRPNKIAVGLSIAFILVVTWGMFGVDIVAILASPIFVVYSHLLSLVAIVYLLARKNKMNEIYIVEMIRLFNSINRTLGGIYQALRPETMADTVEFYQTINGVRAKVDTMFMKVEGIADLAVVFKDKKGNFARVDGKPVWALTNEALGKLEVSEDGMSAAFTAAADLQSGKIQVKADADLGEGVKEIIGELDVELSALDAEFVEITATVRP